MDWDEILRNSSFRQATPNYVLRCLLNLYYHVTMVTWPPLIGQKRTEIIVFQPLLLNTSTNLCEILVSGSSMHDTPYYVFRCLQNVLNQQMQWYFNQKPGGPVGRGRDPYNLSFTAKCFDITILLGSRPRPLQTRIQMYFMWASALPNSGRIAYMHFLDRKEQIIPIRWCSKTYT